MTNNLKKPKYLTIDLLIWCYQRINSKKFLIKEKHQVLQAKLAILLGFLVMLRPQKTWFSERVLLD
jgi:hypothetical protein